jgi:hypothetical protein
VRNETSEGTGRPERTMRAAEFAVHVTRIGDTPATIVVVPLISIYGGDVSIVLASYPVTAGFNCKR